MDSKYILPQKQDVKSDCFYYAKTWNGIFLQCENVCQNIAITSFAPIEEITWNKQKLKAKHQFTYLW